MIQRITTLVASGVLALTLFGVAAAGQFEGGEVAYRRGDYAEALRLLRPLAEQGDTRAQATLGAMHENGQGVPKDYAQAVAWYQKVADQAKAVKDGVDAYANGDYAVALQRLRPLADQENALAQFSLGLMYEQGQGVPQNYAQAVVWFRKAADQGNARAQTSLGVMYASGHGVPQNYAAAGIWFRKAADRGDARAQLNLGSMYRDSQGVPKDYAQAVAWYRKAADQGYALAQLGLGGMYEQGQGVPKDYAQAVVWYRKAADQGDTLAQTSLGAMYFSGHGVPQKYIMAHMWFSLAASRTADTATHELAVKERDLTAAQMTPAQIERRSGWCESGNRIAA